ncbi:MAG: PilZ domain-containing protein [Pyrinomonadaceae bacterium MAG19_C2-C3]|nr:PilZ domain-containing protein [Pyrinomonadaceae bacterium MAG19_C2-C3]
MPERLRSLFAHVRELIGNRRRPPRRAMRLKVAVRLVNSVTATGGHEQVLHGRTQDVSSQGISFVVPAIRLGTDYLIGDNRKLRLTLELPATSIEIQVVAVRYHQLEAGDAAGKNFLVGARITEISAEAKQRLDDYLKPQK